MIMQNKQFMFFENNGSALALFIKQKQKIDVD